MRGRLKDKLAVAVASLMSVATLVWLPHLLAQQTETAPSWTVTGGLSTIRSGYTATLLPSGKVSVAGDEETLLPLDSSISNKQPAENHKNCPKPCQTETGHDIRKQE